MQKSVGSRKQPTQWIPAYSVKKKVKITSGIRANYPGWNFVIFIESEQLKLISQCLYFTEIRWWESTVVECEGQRKFEGKVVYVCHHYALMTHLAANLLHPGDQSQP